MGMKGVHVGSRSISHRSHSTAQRRDGQKQVFDVCSSPSFLVFPQTKGSQYILHHKGRSQKMTPTPGRRA